MDDNALSLIASELEATIPDFSQDEVIPFMKQNGFNDPIEAYRALREIPTDNQPASQEYDPEDIAVNLKNKLYAEEKPQVVINKSNLTDSLSKYMKGNYEK